MKVGWTIKALGELMDVQSGFAFDSKKFSIDLGIPLIRIRDLKSGDATEAKYNGNYDGRFIVRAGDFLIGMDGEFQCYEWKGSDALLNQRVCKLIDFADSLNARFLFYGINKYLKDIEDVTAYATVKHISARQIKAIKFPIPPLAEQGRIVAILDEVFDGIAAAVANAEKNLANAHELLQATLHSALSASGPGSLKTTIGNQIMLQRGFDITKRQQKPGSVPVVSSGGIKSFHDTAMVQGPGVVIGRKGSLGTVFYLESDFWPHDTTLWVKKFNGNNARFVYYFLKALDVAHLDTGAANPALNRNLVHPIEVCWPPISQQKSIVERLDTVSVKSEHLGAIYQQKLDDLAKLKQSILQKAFAGKLNPQPEHALAEAIA